MGSEQFSVFSDGVNVDEAFTKAVEKAQYDHGHEGYTGTIAEKDEFEVIILGSMTFEDAEDKAESLFRLRDDRIDDKWGPAGAIRVKDEDHDGWLFFGWASS